MDLRNLPDGLTPPQRCDERRRRMEEELGISLGSVSVRPEGVGEADEKNCEQMFGQIPIPIGYAGPLSVQFSNDEKRQIHLPLATTEGALVASVNRGCKVISQAGSARTTHVHHGISRSIAFRVDAKGVQMFIGFLQRKSDDWKAVGEQTSGHLNILSHTIDHHGRHVFLTIYADTDEAMGMNMVTIAAQAIGEWIVEQYKTGVEFVTVAGNVDSDKKPSQRTKEHGRGYEVTAEATLPTNVIEQDLKSTPAAMLAVAEAKLCFGSHVAGALGANLHAANVIAALYLATGQDAAHVVEGSLADTTVKSAANGLHVTVRLPAILVGIRGGGMSLPAQKQCLNMLLQTSTNLHPCAQLAESIGAAVLAGEVSLLAAQASHELAKAHKSLGR